MLTYTKQLTEINSWDDFFSHANALSEKGKGDIFETLTKLVLTTRPEYTLILKNVWIQQEGIPRDIREKLNLPTSDEGIDIVAETFTGEFWAIQCKFKGQNQTPTYKELSTFGVLANSYCKNISLALLVHTGEKGVKKQKYLGENYSEIGLEFWLGLSTEDWERIHQKLKGKSVRPTHKIPRPHQDQAINGATKHFIKNKKRRGRLIMPCGTGKSLTAFWIANALRARSVIIAVPSLALIKQSLGDWTREFVAHQEDPRPEWLVICSDESTAKIDNDEFVSDAHSMGIPTTTNIDAISAFLTNNTQGRKIIFITYQSSDKLAQASKKCSFSFDLAILDEAHKTVGVKSKTFSILLTDKNISISKRIFMTATERVMRGSNEDVYSMDDEAIYGSLFYQLTFKEAIHSDPPIICDYKILTITVSNDEIKQLIAKNKLLTDKGEKIEEQEAQSLASAIALRKATQKYGIKHAISFHRSIKSAEDFSKLNNAMNSGNLDDILLKSSHISSKKSAGERARLLIDFSKEQLALMSNARCLTEGVDVPAIDCVLFADPKQSIIDIVQASGRALRPYIGKDCGYIMLPLIVPDEESFEEFTDSTPFKEVARIISALSTQDEGIAEEFRIINSGRQNGDGRKIIFEGTIPVGMKLDLGSFAEKINTKIWERVARVNWMPFTQAREIAHSLKLKGNKEWFEYSKSGKLPQGQRMNKL
jgi:predicted helicase